MFRLGCLSCRAASPLHTASDRKCSRGVMAPIKLAEASRPRLCPLLCYVAVVSVACSAATSVAVFYALDSVRSNDATTAAVTEIAQTMTVSRDSDGVATVTIDGLLALSPSSATRRRRLAEGNSSKSEDVLSITDVSGFTRLTISEKGSMHFRDGEGFPRVRIGADDDEGERDTYVPGSEADDAGNKPEQDPHALIILMDKDGNEKVSLDAPKDNSTGSNGKGRRRRRAMRMRDGYGKVRLEMGGDDDGTDERTPLMRLLDENETIRVDLDAADEQGWAESGMTAYRANKGGPLAKKKPAMKISCKGDDDIAISVLDADETPTLDMRPGVGLTTCAPFYPRAVAPSRPPPSPHAHPSTPAPHTPPRPNALTHCPSRAGTRTARRR